MLIHNNSLDIVSLFSGCGGLDLGFAKAGFTIKWANEFDSEIWETFEKNHPTTTLDKRSITEISSSEIPDCIGIVGGPPCQSWSEAGAQRGINDSRGKLFFDFIRILKDKQPAFFLAENVSGMLAYKHRPALSNILRSFELAGYGVHYKLLNVKHYDVPQDRRRVIFVGFRKDLNIVFNFPLGNRKVPTLRNAIGDLKDSSLPAIDGNRPNIGTCAIPNHEHMIGGFSTLYMSRNRVRSWDEPSFTIQAGGRHAPIHPQAPKMLFIEQNKRVFVPGKENEYRRLSIRECARIQTFPDDFIFFYNNVATGYKMVGNAVPPNFAYSLAKQVLLHINMGEQGKMENRCEQNMDLTPQQLALY
jgi:DNA (cytosine-5)-methyltransferase 1